MEGINGERLDDRLCDSSADCRCSAAPVSAVVCLQLGAADLAYLRKTDLLNGGVGALFERVNLRRIEPVIMKGNKREKVIIDRYETGRQRALGCVLNERRPLLAASRLASDLM